MDNSAERLVLAQFGVGYARLPRLGAIEALHAVDLETNLTLCGQAVAIRWSAEDAAETEIDCARCCDAIANRGRGA
ncbi:MAG: hypothetical protein ACXVH3_26700 [Solirubrobacteraceae bacterium]